MALAVEAKMMSLLCMTCLDRRFKRLDEMSSSNLQTVKTLGLRFCGLRSRVCGLVDHERARIAMIRDRVRHPANMANDAKTRSSSALELHGLT